MKNRPASGKLIVFEGPDGVGKSTLSAGVVEELNIHGKVCEFLTFPGQEPGTLGRLVYEVHHAPDRFSVKSLTSASKQALHIAAHLDAIERIILPTLLAGVHVVLDRFWWSTWVYGSVAGIDRRVLRKLIDAERVLWGRTVPALVILVNREQPIDRTQDLHDWPKLVKEYATLASKEAKRHPITRVMNDGSLETVLSETLQTVAETLFGSGIEHSVKGMSKQLAIGFRRGHTTGLLAKAPSLLTHLLPAKPTVVFDSYWRFAAERQEVFFRRLEGKPAPWTKDGVLAIYKFTNAYRASDRVSQYLIRRVIYRNDLPIDNEEVFFRIILFKLFNKVETWALLENALGELTFDRFKFEAYDRVLGRAKASGQAIYSAAYIMPSGGRGAIERTKHRLHLRLVERMMQDELPKKLADAPNMQKGFELLRAYPTIGDFLAYQYIIDVNYSNITDFSEDDFVVPGPGAYDGIRKCFSDLGGLSEPEVIRFMADIQDQEFSRLGLKFRSLWGRKLQLIDCQNLFCETDKYARVMHPEFSGHSGRLRIKQKFNCNHEPIQYMYPPKWGINEEVSRIGERDLRHFLEMFRGIYSMLLVQSIRGRVNCRLADKAGHCFCVTSDDRLS